ncbi:MAG: 4-hydroxy-tetrahydrodipicolinate reductase [Hyphomicrobiales bacterium]|nr:4-hydroxy-tetrahydrodipicolinate reductase [Hyphomicrobiales bacterium]
MRLVVVGAGGRMGSTLIRAIRETKGCVLTGAIERENHPHLGKDAGMLAGAEALNVPLASDALAAFAKADGVLDFTTPAASAAFAALAAQARLVHVIGTTGLGAAELEKLRAAARHAVIIQSGNMSLGVNLLAGLVKQAAAALGPEFDIEIVEMHHRHKRDAPSGTALGLGRAAAAGRGQPLEDLWVKSRDGETGARVPGTIGFATLRGGDVVGEHSVIFAAEGERLELTHKATDRRVFARGALRAALWAANQPPGLYGMADVLSL